MYLSLVDDKMKWRIVTIKAKTEYGRKTLDRIENQDNPTDPQSFNPVNPVNPV
jgi:hypothetical protein